MIIRYTKNATIKYAYLDIFPDQFKTEKEKKEDGWIKNTMDYFTNKAYAEYRKNKEGFIKNYDLVKGILRMEDFYQDPETKSFVDMLKKDIDLPSYVKHYSIITTPINELIGEVSKRPDTYRVKAFDDESKSEELQFKTDLLQQFVLGEAKQKILEKAALNGEELSEEDTQKLTMDMVKDELDDYTSVAEKWGNHILTASKAEFNLKEKGEDAARDLLIAAREFYILYEDNSKTGFNVEVSNTKNTWFLTTPDRKYVSDPTGRAQGAYAAGTVQVMELSEIIEQIPDITKEEIDHLRSTAQDDGISDAIPSNLGNPNAIPGQDSIMYDTYDPLVAESRMLIEGEMSENNDSLKDFLGITSNTSAFGYKYVVVRAYFISKKKIAKVTFTDMVGNEQTMLVDESYKSGTIPTQTSITWGWVNQWYQGIKIGPDIYHLKPFKLFNYCPIIGMVHEVKNTEARSLVDMMKPFQVIYNVCMNQLFKLLEKEIGNVGSVNIRRIPKLKDGDDQDALDMWEMEARERGIIFDDDSPENTKSAVTNQSVARNIDLTRTNEIQSRYNLAIQMKNECWELVGMSKQRMGSVSPSESATGTNTAVEHSYSQTEPIMVAHEYVMGQLYQAIIDASLYIQSSKPQSTISYITSQGESAFVQVNGSDLNFRDLKVFPTNRPEDTQMFNEFRALAQPILQNGGSPYTVWEIYSTKSVRQIRKVLKDLKDRQEAMQNQQMQQKQQEIDQQRELATAQMEQAQAQRQEDIANQNYQNELDRINKKEIALIGAESMSGPLTDANQNSVPDVLEIGKLVNAQSEATNTYNAKVAEIQAKNTQALQKLQLERERLQVDRDNQKNDLQIAKVNARNRSSKPK